MSFAQEVMRSIEDALNNLRVPASSLVGQIAGTLLPPPAADADVPYAPTSHTHPLSDLKQSGATDGQVATWNAGTSAWIPATAAAGSLPLTTRGDLLTRDATTNVRLPVGASGTFLRSNGTDPSWQTLADVDMPFINLTGSTFVGGTLPIANGGTDGTTVLEAFDNLSPLTTAGDLIYFDGTHNARRAIGSTYDLLGVVGGVPTWGPAVGTFTPTYGGATTAGTTTYVTQTGRYVRVGPWCLISVRVWWTAATGTGDAVIGGLPFAGKNLSNFAQALAVQTFNVTFAASGAHAIIGAGASQATLSSPTSNGASTPLAVEAAGIITLSGVYEVN